MEWTAIGMSEALAFNGVYEGNGFAIFGLSACGDTYSGLFGQVGATSNGRNAGIYNIVIEYGTSSSSTGVVGGTAAVLMNGATAESCAVIGDLYGNEGVGGVIGIVRKSATISNSYHNGNVNGNSKIGGILGYAESGTARIENCYHTPILLPRRSARYSHSTLRAILSVYSRLKRALHLMSSEIKIMGIMQGGEKNSIRKPLYIVYRGFFVISCRIGLSRFD